LNKNESRAFWKFFLTYFISVALLILVAGHFYFSQMKQQNLELEHFSMIKYMKQLRMGRGMQMEMDEESAYDYDHLDISISDFSIDNFRRHGDVFEKYIPARRGQGYLYITKETVSYDRKMRGLFYTLIFTQLLLLSLFAILSFLLARNALLPLRKNIESLDRFAKDLIHDLNTPVTSIGLNLKVLSKEPHLKEHRALKRLQKSANDISDLQTNLRFLLQEKSYEIEAIDIGKIVDELILSYALLYPLLRYETKNLNVKVFANKLALKQVLDNLLSNACKYSEKNSKICFSFEKNKLEIKDEGIGIKHPERVFERNYTENSSGSGIGLDIVKRLCDMMNIEVKVISKGDGTSVILSFEPR
jgi:two-component system OmpR family sensor kinase